MKDQQIVCDRCHVKLVLTPSNDLARFVAEHQEHNFTGLRVVKVKFLCPNRARHYEQIELPIASPQDIEALAAVEHRSWASWTKWMLDKITEELKSAAEGGKKPIYYDALLAVNQTENVQRWRRQMETPYAELSEREKESDRKVVREKLTFYRPNNLDELVNEALGAAYTAGMEAAAEMEGCSWTGKGITDADAQADEAQKALEGALGITGVQN